MWPNPFSTRLPTSQSGTVDDPGEESSPHGTEAVCLCSGRVGRSHTVRRKGRRPEEMPVDGKRETKGDGEEKINLMHFGPLANSKR